MAQVLGILKDVGLLTAECSKDFGSVLQTACISFFISKMLGYLIILGAFAVKVPQILIILKDQSVAGLTKSMFLTELVVYAISALNGYKSGFPISTYGENIVIAVQNVIIIFLIYNYTTKSFTEFAVILAAFAGVSFGFISGALPMQLLKTLSAGNIFLMMISRVPQILQNHQSKSTGKLSLTTFALNFLGAVARVFTTLKEVDDVVVLASFIVGAVLNGIILGQIIVLGDKKTAPTPGSQQQQSTTPKRKKED